MNKILLLLFIAISFSFGSSAQVDSTIGIKAPGNVSRDYKELAHYLCDGLSNDREKANAIYNWITHNIKYDIKSFQKGDIKHPKIEKVLKTRTTMCEGYSVLFTEMCREAGLRAANVEGYAKDWIFDNGDKLYIPRHQWCAVMIDGQWELADPTWGAGGIYQSPTLRKILNKVTRKKITYAKRLRFRFKYNPKYFLEDPAEFKLKHLPADPYWQLADSVMPLVIFETGDSAVKNFNTKYCKTKKNDPELTRISELSEEQKDFEFADRAYAFNNKYPVILALKLTYRAASEVEKALTDSTVTDGRILVNDAVLSLKKSEEYIKEQKKSFPDQYSLLKKKNKTKNQLAKQDIRKIKTDDKRLIAESKKFVHAVKTKTDKLGKSVSKAQKKANGIYSEKIDEIETGKVQKRMSSPEIKALDDSIAARTTRINVLDAEVSVLSEKMSIVQAENRKRLDSLAINIDLADSMLVLQTRSRLGMNDNYDDEIILYSSKFNEYKFGKADSLQKHYLAFFDTIALMQENKQKMQLAQMELYKKNLRGMEQYKKWNNNNAELAGNYKESVKKYMECLNGFTADISGIIAYLKGHRKLFEYLGKVNKKEITLAGYMDKAENMRKILEERALAKKQELDMNENQKQQLAVKNIRKVVDNIAAQ